MTHVEIPRGSIEREFLEFWAEKLLDPRDPQNARWLGLEMNQIARGRDLAAKVGAIAPLKGARVLDLGCQTGGLAIALAKAGAEVTGADVDATLTRAAAIRARCHGVENVRFEVCRAERLPFDRDRFDLVTFVDVIEHVEDAAQALAEVARVLAPGGLLYLQGPNRFSLRWFVRDPHYHMTGISVLPPALGRFYVTRVRRRPRYDVGVFPIGARVVHRLQHLGMHVESPSVPRAWRPRIRHEVAMRFASMFEIVARKAER